MTTDCDIIEVDGREWVTSGTAEEITGLSNSSIQRRVNNGEVESRGHPDHSRWRVLLLEDCKGVEGNKRKQISPERVVDKYRSGEALKSIASDLGVSNMTVYRRLKDEGVNLRNPGNPESRTLVSLNDTKRKVIRYTRWALGETQSHFAERFGVTGGSVSHVEVGRSEIGKSWDLSGWGDLENLAVRANIDPEDPKRLLHPKSIPDMVYRLKSEVGGSWVAASNEIGVTFSCCQDWGKGRFSPGPQNHKALRRALRSHGLWSPPKIEDQTEDPGVELSYSDRRQICALSANTSISDIAMMYGVEIAEIRKVLREGE